MKTTTKKTEKTEVKQVEEKTQLREAFALWIAEATTGTKYLYGQLKNEKGEVVCSLRGWFNKNKKNPNEPDIRIYERDVEGNQGEELACLWDHISKNSVRYLSGYTNEKEELVAYYNKDKEDNKPYIRVYYSK